MRYLTIKDNLFLVEQPVDYKSKNHKTPEALNHIWIYDRSGSMSGVLPQLAQDLIKKAKEIPAGDTITLGWFSGEGEFNFMLKGFKVTEARDYKVLEDTINRNKSYVGATCFSEILHDTETVIKDLSNIGNNFALCFFTDGYPCVSNYSKEIEGINSAIKKIQGKISSSLLVGYGNYYNKSLMSEMAEKLGGALIHSAALAEFSVALESFITDARENETKISVDLKAKGSLVFSISGSQINVYQPEDGKISFVPTKAKEDRVFILTDRVPSSAQEIVLTEDRVSRPTKFEPLIKGAYAAAYLLTQRTKTDQALEVLGTLGDVAAIDAVSNAFTNAEYGIAEKRLQSAMSNRKKRFLNGRKENYLPAADAFCLLDVLDILMKDEQAYFYPYHDEFEYSKIGAGAKVKEGYPKFSAIENPKCSLNALTWNDTKLNLSIRAKIPGTVPLINGDPASVGLAKDYPTFVYRNYALVKDGFLNVPKLPIIASVKTLNKLSDEGLLSLNVVGPQVGPWILRLDCIPVINRSIAEGKTSATELCKKVIEETKLMAKIKAMKFIKDELDPEGELNKGIAVTEAQEEVLAANGVTKNGFAPPTEKVEPTDFYMAKEFDVKLKGLSTIPSVTKVKETIEAKGKLTPSMLLVKNGLDHFEKSVVNNFTKGESGIKMKAAWLADEIVSYQRILLNIRSDIQKTKFAVILGKRWFDEFTSREKNVLKVGDVECTIGVREVRVDI